MKTIANFFNKKIIDEYKNTLINIQNQYNSLENKFDILLKRTNSIEEHLIGQKNIFSDHYEYWRAKRITAIVEHYGESYFNGIKVLELGCGYGDIGFVLMTLGADVTFCEGRKEHCDILRKKFPNNRIYQVNLENEWPFAEDEQFDLILHLGLLYHLDSIEFSLKKCAKHTKNLVLETEVCDSDDPDFILKIEECSQNYDQSLIGRGSRPSAPYVENILQRLNFSFERIKDSRCNAMFHIYDWEVKNTKKWENGLRRFWFCTKNKDTIPTLKHNDLN